MRFICLAAVLVSAAAFLPQRPSLSSPSSQVCRRPSPPYILAAAAEDVGAEGEDAPPAKKSGFKGFGDKPTKKVVQKTKAQMEREKYASAYDELKTQGVPEYAVYIKEKGATDESWKFVGSMAVPRNTKVDLAIYENETNLVKGAYKMYPRLKDKEAGGFEYGYNLKAYPDEPVKMAVKPSGSNNPVSQWFANMLNPLDASGVQS